MLFGMMWRKDGGLLLSDLAAFQSVYLLFLLLLYQKECPTVWQPRCSVCLCYALMHAYRKSNMQLMRLCVSCYRASQTGEVVIHTYGKNCGIAS
jgi:hypothetical protein